VPRLGVKAFVQAAGFLRIRNGGNPLDASAVHPESYGLVESIAKAEKIPLTKTTQIAELLKKNLRSYITEAIGEPTLRDIINELEKLGINVGIKHIANSGAILNIQDSYKRFDAIRPGILLYGYLPSNEIDNKLFLKPVLKLKCRIISLKDVEKNQYVGYDKSYITTTKSKIAVLPIGYGDGYSNNFMVVIEKLDKLFVLPIISKLCMNYCMIDVTNINNIQIGDVVIIYGHMYNQEQSLLQAPDFQRNINMRKVFCKISNTIERIVI
jgi:alanine racemase